MADHTHTTVSSESGLKHGKNSIKTYFYEN